MTDRDLARALVDAGFMPLAEYAAAFGQEEASVPTPKTGPRRRPRPSVVQRPTPKFRRLSARRKQARAS